MNTTKPTRDLTSRTARWGLCIFGTLIAVVICARAIGWMPNNVEKARAAWKKIDPEKRRQSCKEWAQIPKDWGSDSDILLVETPSDIKWTGVYVKTDLIPTPGWYGMKVETRNNLFNRIVFCYTRGGATLYDYKNTNIQLAYLNLKSDGTGIETQLFDRVPQLQRAYQIQKEQEVQQPVNKCETLSWQSGWYTFAINTVMRDDENDGTSIYLNSNWKKIPIYQKEQLITYAGKCRKANYAIFYDGYSGKELARYYPVLGAKIHQE